MTGTVRPYRSGDAASCAAVIAAALEGMDGLGCPALHHLLALNAPERLAPELARCHTLVAEEDGGIVGVGSLDGPEIRRLYVHPGWRGRGIGGALADALEREARAIGFDALVVDAPPSSERFWTRRGYARMHAETARWDEAEIPFVHLRRELAEPGDREEAGGAC